MAVLLGPGHRDRRGEVVDTLAFIPGALGFVLGTLTGFVAGALCTVKAFLIMHKRALPSKG